MKAVTSRVAVCCVLFGAVGLPALALGPVDGEVSAVWWANEYTTSSDTAAVSSDAGAPGLRAELWTLERYGVQASHHASEPDDSNGADYTSVDVLWRAFAPTENNFVALGLGWQRMDLAGFQDSPSGIRVSVRGNVGILDMLEAYGGGSYLPTLGDSGADDPLAGSFEDIGAFEYELGVAWKAMPFMNVQAGYRVSNVSYTQRAVTVSGSPGVLVPVGSGSGGITTLTAGTGSCSDCTPAAVLPADASETDASGFFVGMGFEF